MRCSISLFVRHACLVTCALILIDCHAAHAKDAIDLERFRPSAIARWEQAMVDFDQKNDAETHPDDSILFVGSSSIVRWDHISTDVVPYHAIQRGFGGSRWSDVAVYAERLIKPHKFRAVVFFVANDITGGDNDRTPAEVLALFAHVRDVVRVH
ncbi:MAG: hypothetical protein KDA60_17330, partial [Planctomycetales bacterium]|nr:hypothetical protein [Planctomycetales bacterium]